MKRIDGAQKHFFKQPSISVEEQSGLLKCLACIELVDVLEYIFQYNAPDAREYLAVKICSLISNERVYKLVSEL